MVSLCKIIGVSGNLPFVIGQPEILKTYLMLPVVIKIRRTGIPHQCILTEHIGAFLIGLRHLLSKTIIQFKLVLIIRREGGKYIS